MTADLLAPPVVLLVDSPGPHQPSLTEALELEGYTVWPATSGSDARKILVEARRSGTEAGVIVIQQQLPDVDGRVLAAFLRANSETPIVLCGPVSQTIGRSVLYNIGIDAHLPSPPDLHELNALLQSLLRRRRVQPSPPAEAEGRSLKIGALQIRERQRAVSVDDQPVALTPIQYKLLLSLARRPNNLVPIHELTETVWNCEPDNGTAALIHTQMARLRARLRDNAETHVSIVSVPSRGYRLLAA